MKKIYFGIIIGLLLIAIYDCFGQTQTGGRVRAIPLEDFFKNPESASYQLSPDGKHIAYSAPYESRMNVYVMRTDDRKPVRITSETERSIAGFFWGNNQRILFLKDTGGDENYQLYGVDIDGSNSAPLAAFEGVTIRLIDLLEENDSEIIIGLNKNHPQVFDPYRLNIETGELTQLAQNPGNIQGWLTDHDGKLRVAIALDGVNRSILYRDSEDDSFRTIYTSNFKETISPFLFTADNKYLYAASNVGRDKLALIEFDPNTGEEARFIYENDKYDISSAPYSTRHKKLLGVGYESHEGFKRHFFDKGFEKKVKAIEEKVGGYPFGITSENKEEDVMIVRTFSDRTLGAYYIYDEKNDKFTFLAEISPWLKESEMCDMHCITYTTRDGLTVEAYLTLPQPYTIETACNLPVVVNPHGGPWARDSWGFDPSVQFLANRGYAVLQMNFRGSTGYGRQFLEASYKQWGRTMQDDITDGVNWLIEKGIADPKKVGIYGGSYGGYAVLAGLAFTPDLYACGVDMVGVSNIFTLLESLPPYWQPMIDMMYEQVGHPVEDKELLESVSPVFHADKMKAPLFIAQGANDPRVKKAESDQMVAALQARGVEVEYMVKENEGHGFTNEENRFEFFRAMEKFLASHLQ